MLGPWWATVNLMGLLELLKEVLLYRLLAFRIWLGVSAQ
jgi:hypothetical protein